MSGTSSPPPADDASAGRRAGLPARPAPPLTLAVSDCLLGRAVRYDGSDAAFALPHAALDPLFRYRGICPEVGIGMSVPRAPIRLVGTGGAARVRGVADPALDVTEALTRYGAARAAELDEVAGYVFMRGSPSCGLFGVKVYPLGAEGDVLETPRREGRGAFAAAVTGARPLLPVEEGERLHDSQRREHFLVRVFAYAHWQALVRAGITAARLIEFHSRYKYLLMAHSVPHYRRAGRLLGALASDPAVTAEAYARELMTGLARPATQRSHVNALEHLQGYFEGAGRAAVAAAVQRYRDGEASLSTPVRAIRAQLEQQPDPYVAGQVYLEPYPGAPAA